MGQFKNKRFYLGLGLVDSYADIPILMNESLRRPLEMQKEHIKAYSSSEGC